MTSGNQIPGHHVRLEPFEADCHGDGLWEATGGAEHAGLWTYMSDGPFLDRSLFQNAMKEAEAQTDPSFFAILQQEDGRVVGRCALLNIRPAHGVAEVGHVLYSKHLQGTRGGTEVQYLLARYVFEQLNYRRYEWKCNALNANSRRAAERLGFQFEGIFRQHMIVKDRNRDTAWFSMLDSEWPGVKTGMEKWLSDENFTPEGRQRMKLQEFVGLSSL